MFGYANKDKETKKIRKKIQLMSVARAITKSFKFVEFFYA